MIAVALRELALPASTPVVLVGKSRGAGLEVAAATAPILKPQLKGLLAIGLTQEEEYVRVAVPDGTPDPPEVMLHTYDVLPDFPDVPLAVIQSTNDEYIKAGDARGLFGPDTPTRRFRPITAEDHNFSGAVNAMYAEMRRSFDWILSR